MDQRLVTALLSVGRVSRQDAEAALVSAFTAMGAGDMRFERLEMHLTPYSSKLETHAAADWPQAQGMTVVVSLSDLVDLVQVAARGNQSFGEALDAEGFRPVSGKKRIGGQSGIPTGAARGAASQEVLKHHRDRIHGCDPFGIFLPDQTKVRYWGGESLLHLSLGTREVLTGHICKADMTAESTAAESR